MLVFVTYASNEVTWAILMSEHLQSASPNHCNTVDTDLTNSSQRKQTTFSVIESCLSTFISPFKLCLLTPIGFLHIAFSSIFKFPQVLFGIPDVFPFTRCVNLSFTSSQSSDLLSQSLTSGFLPSAIAIIFTTLKQKALTLFLDDSIY